jgi:hypothetical protein
MVNETYDFNDADLQSDFVIPSGTIVSVEMMVRPGGEGDGGLLTRSKNGDAYMLACEFTVQEGQYAKRKIFTNLVVEGQTDGHKKAIQITRSKLRAMIESAFGIKPSDKSETAVAMRRVTGFDAFLGLCFVAKLGVEPARDGYQARNTILEVITPDKPQWKQLKQLYEPAQPATVSTNVITPAWA